MKLRISIIVLLLLLPTMNYLYGRNLVNQDICINSFHSKLKISAIFNCLSDVDLTKANTLINMVSERQNTFTENQLNQLIEKLKPVLAKEDYLLFSKDYVGSSGYYKNLISSSKFGNKEASYWLWFHYRYSKPRKALEYLEDSAEGGFPEAQREFGLYLLNDITRKDYGIELLEKASFDGNSQARKSLLFYSEYLKPNQLEFWETVEGIISNSQSIKMNKIQSWKSFCSKLKNNPNTFDEIDDNNFTKLQAIAFSQIILKCIYL